MRSRSDNSHVEYYTVQELPSVLISRSPLVRQRVCTLATVCNFRIIHPLSVIRQFRQFRNGTLECARPTKRKRLQTTLKFNRTAASGSTEIFLLSIHPLFQPSFDISLREYFSFFISPNPPVYFSSRLVSSQATRKLCDYSRKTSQNELSCVRKYVDTLYIGTLYTQDHILLKQKINK